MKLCSDHLIAYNNRECPVCVMERNAVAQRDRAKKIVSGMLDCCKTEAELRAALRMWITGSTAEYTQLISSLANQ